MAWSVTEDEKDIFLAVANSLQVMVAVSSELVRELHASAAHSADLDPRGSSVRGRGQATAARSVTDGAHPLSSTVLSE